MLHLISYTAAVHAWACLTGNRVCSGQAAGCGAPAVKPESPQHHQDLWVLPATPCAGDRISETWDCSQPAAKSSAAAQEPKRHTALWERKQGEGNRSRLAIANGVQSWCTVAELVQRGFKASTQSHSMSNLRVVNCLSLNLRCCWLWFLQLAQYLRWKRRLQMLQEALSGLLFLHSQGYLLGQLSSNDMFVGVDGKVCTLS